jgi:AraC family transcriptional regulator of adaptative response / DNA-3-methyladenine glycosylase II
MMLGVPAAAAEQVVAVARLIVEGTLRLEPGCDVVQVRRILLGIEGMTEAQVTMIVMRALPWPDAFPASDPGLLRAAGASTPAELEKMAEGWRPWRAYAAHHLWLRHEALLSRPRAEKRRMCITTGG